MLNDSICQAIGSTPLVRIDLGHNVPVYAKLEYMNPGGSLKDRAALYMIEQAEKQGRLKKGGTIIDASSGNMGISLAMIGRAKGYRVIITTTKKCSEEKLKTLKAFGAEVIICEYVEDSSSPDSYHSVATRLSREIDGAFMTNQYLNTENAEGHYHYTGPEIYKQTGGKITHFFAAAGTCGTISGVGKYLKQQNKNIKVIGVDNINSYYSTKGHPKHYKLEGIGIDFDTPVLYKEYVDEILPVRDEDAIDMISKVSAATGVFGGFSAGAVMFAIAAYAKDNMKPSDLGVFVIGDSGRAYLSKLEF